jgi:cytochrome P450
MYDESTRPNSSTGSAAGPITVDGARSGLRSQKERDQSHSEPARPAPCSPALPLLGHLPRIRRLGMLKFLDEEWRKHGDVFRIELGASSALVIAHPDALERVLASHRERFVKGRSYDGLRQILGDGLIAAVDPAWRNQRAVMQPSFHRSGLKNLVAAIAESAQLYFEDLRRRNPNGAVLDIHREMVKLTLDVVVRALFGPHLLSASAVRYETLCELLDLVSERSNGVPIPLWIPTPGNMKFKRVLRELDDIIYRMLAKARAERQDQTNTPSKTLLDMLLDAVDAETGQPLPDKLVRDELLTMFVAGHETTALTLTWMFALLEGRDDVWSQVCQEVQVVLDGRFASFEDLSKLPYTRAVIDETLRVRGPAAVVGRDAIESDNLLGFEVRPGDRILPYFAGVHRHPAYWSQPDRFMPERFLPENSADRDRWCYTPFSAGQRVCIGNMFSLHESVLILSMIAQRAVPRLVPGQNIEPVMIATVRPSAPVMVDWRWRD